LEKVKEAIADYLCVYQIKPGHTNVICLLGSPGVGKTSIAKKITEALKREFIKISMAGCSDSTYLLGSPRVYVNSQPGVLINKMSSLRYNNPVIILDEIDKTVNKFGGGGTAIEYALLDILDKDNNHRFRDHFMGVDYSLTNVLFICTANSLEDIPRPLVNRLEVIYIPGYSTDEKFLIAKNYLIPELRQKLECDDSYLKLTETQIRLLIDNYTAECGIRRLKSRLEKILVAQLRKKIPKKISNEKIEEILVDYLQPSDTGSSEKKFSMIPGRALGMFTGSSSGIMSIDASIKKWRPKGEIALPAVSLSGNVSHVMTDSAIVAVQAVWHLLSRVDKEKKVKLESIETIQFYFNKVAIPKDGPSAGIALSMSLISLLYDKALPY
jgi:ATP-dependent Lon protease